MHRISPRSASGWRASWRRGSDTNGWTGLRRWRLRTSGENREWCTKLEVVVVADTDRVRRVRLTLFTLEAANRVVAEIGPELEQLVEARKDFGRIQSRIDVLELTSAGASPDNPDMRELATLTARRDT